MKILLAVDGSKNSHDAVSSLIKHADWFRDAPNVCLTYVHLPVPRVGMFGHGPSKQALANYYREEGEAALAKAKKMLTKAKIPHADSILIGEPAQTICKHAANEKCDMIYMGTRGLGAAANMLIGSVATKVLHNASIPVMLVK